MRILLNGQERDVAPGTTIGVLVDTVVADRARIAVERNREIVPRATWDEVPVDDGDRVEVVTLVGGG